MQQSYHILLIEDNPDDVLLIKRVLKKLKVLNPLDVASDGEEAIHCLQKIQESENKSDMPVLILLDLKLPKRSGFEVLEWIRSQKHIKRIPVIILTSSKEGPDVNKAYDLGANSYLVKPVSFENLVEMMKNLKLYWMILNEKPEVIPHE